METQFPSIDLRNVEPRCRKKIGGQIKAAPLGTNLGCTYTQLWKKTPPVPDAGEL
jgi:hypothetical protein